MYGILVWLSTLLATNSFDFSKGFGIATRSNEKQAIPSCNCRICHHTWKNEKNIHCYQTYISGKKILTQLSHRQTFEICHYKRRQVKLTFILGRNTIKYGYVLGKDDQGMDLEERVEWGKGEGRGKTWKVGFWWHQGSQVKMYGWLKCRGWMDGKVWKEKIKQLS